MDEAEIEGLLAEQRRELMAAKDLESDLELAFRLQLQEAMAASLAIQPLQPSISTASTSSSSSQSQAQAQAPPPGNHRTEPPPPHLSFHDYISDFDDDLDGILGFDEFPLDGMSFRKKEVERHPTIHYDRRTGREYLGIAVPGPMYCNMDYMENPFGEGCSSSRVCDRPFKLYFKGLVSDEIVRGRDVTLAAIGVAICDSKDNLVSNIRKPLFDDSKNRRVVELKALIEGLNAALSLDVKRINFYCVNMTIYKQITGRWSVKQQKIATLVNQVVLLQQKFEICHPLLVAGKDVKFAFKLARDAIESQITRSVEICSAKNSKETCTICLEDTDASEMFAVDGCSHRYCFSCMKQHVEVKVLHGMMPGCPHEGCNIPLKLDSCRKILSPKFVEMMSQRIKEDSVPVTEKVYCPYPKCSTLMSKSEVLEYANNMFSGANRSGVRKCIKCHGLFCIDCKVPWHSNMSCHEYRRSNPRAEEAKLKSLATQKLWRQCVKCNHMIELAEGCYHMTCRCGYEFCYTCGAEWKNKKATCSCPLWDEENILHEDEEDFYDDDDDDDYDDYYEDYRFDFDDEFDEFNEFNRHFIL